MATKISLEVELKEIVTKTVEKDDEETESFTYKMEGNAGEKLALTTSLKREIYPGAKFTVSFNNDQKTLDETPEKPAGKGKKKQ